MKTLIYPIALGTFLLSACTTQGYKIEGTVDGVSDGTYVYMQKWEDRKPVNLDSTKVVDGTFSFEGTKEKVVPVFIVAKSEKGNEAIAELLLEKGNINISLGADSKVSGTVNNELLQNFNDKMNKVKVELRDIYVKINRDTTLTDDQRQTYINDYNAKENDAQEYTIKTISENISNPFGTYLLANNYFLYEHAELKEMLGTISGELCSKRLDGLKDYVDACDKTSVGKKFVDFSMKDPEGKEVKLSDFIKNNKYTLIDFWASWCGPCRREMPNVVEAFKAYKDKGFGIVGVSLDDNADNWKNAIKMLHIEWPQMSDLKSWDCEGAKLYGVNSIPATVIIDQNGVIIERNLAGEELQAKLKELFK